MPFNCPVCYEALDKGADGVQGQGSGDRAASALVLTSCGHMVHRTCLAAWFARNPGPSKCPKCTKRTEMRDALAIFPSVGGGDDEEAFEEVPKKPTKKSKKGKKDEGPGSSPSALDLREVPELTCNQRACEDFHAIHSTLVDDYNDLARQRAAQKVETATANRACAVLQSEVDYSNGILKAQDTRIRTLLKRGASQAQSEPESDEEEDEEEVLDEE